MEQQNTCTNLSFLEGFAKGDKAKMKKYISMYLSTAPGVILEMISELEAKNWQNLRLKAHSIKPQVQYMGISQLKDILADIEDIILNDSDKLPLADLVKRAKILNDQAVSELTQFVEAN